MPTREEYIQLAMKDLGLTREQAVEYVMERQYNHMNHEQAMNEIKKKSWIWENNDNN